MTANQNYLEPSIVPFVDGLFPKFYRTDSPLFVQFVKSYHEWLEDPEGLGSTTLYSRGFLDYRDVDRSLDRFLVHIKQKYLNGLRFTTVSDTRQLIKHAKDLYRAKGSPRAVDLFFRLLYDEVASLYYPKDDILVPSSGTWTKPTYLEVSISGVNASIEGKRVKGLTSGATGFIDSVVRRVIAGKLADTAYLSAVEGSFQSGEVVWPTDGSVTTDASPRVVGSLNSLLFDASGSGQGYEVGDVLPVNSPNGTRGLARVSETLVQTGLIELNLLAGGFGYTNATQLIVSDTVLALSGVAVSNAYARDAFRFYDVITQPLAAYHFRGANGVVNPGDVVRAWSNSTTVSGNGVVLSANYSNSTAGVLLLSTRTGSLNAANIFSGANAVGLGTDVGGGGYVDQTATGWVIGTANLVLSLSAQTGSFSRGEEVTQGNPLFPTDGSVQGRGVVRVGSPSSLALSTPTGVFRPGAVRGSSSGASAVVQSVGLSVGLRVTNGSFSTLPGNFVKSGSVSYASVTFQGTGVTAQFSAANTLLNTETFKLNTDQLNSIRAANLAGPYGLTGNATANHSTTFASYLTFANVTVGSISNVFTVTTGTQFDAPPIAAVVEPRTSTLNRFDLTLRLSGVTGSFVSGEAVTQAATGARCLVTQTGNSVLTATSLRMNLVNSFVPTTNSTTVITGLQSGAVANVTSVWADRRVPPSGRDALVSANTVTSAGAVSAVQVVDSGFGFVPGELVWLGTGDAPGTNAAVGIVVETTMGTGRGYYSQTGGFMSDKKKLFDGDFYQNFSYEISSSHQLAAYEVALKRVVHVAGMKVFGRFVHPRTVGAQITPTGSTFRRV